MYASLSTYDEYSDNDNYNCDGNDNNSICNGNLKAYSNYDSDTIEYIHDNLNDTNNKDDDNDTIMRLMMVVTKLMNTPCYIMSWFVLKPPNMLLPVCNFCACGRTPVRPIHKLRLRISSSISIAISVGTVLVLAPVLVLVLALVLVPVFLLREPGARRTTRRRRRRSGPSSASQRQLRLLHIWKGQRGSCWRLRSKCPFCAGLRPAIQQQKLLSTP